MGQRKRTNHDAQLKTGHAGRERAGFRCGSVAEFRLNGRSFVAARLHSTTPPQRNKMRHVKDIFLDDVNKMRIPRDGDQRSELMSITIPK
jgi:hypothetical protein